MGTDDAWENKDEGQREERTGSTEEKERLEVAGSKGEEISDDLASYRRQAKEIADSAAAKAN